MKLTSILQEMLEEEGYEIRSAGDGRDGYFVYLFFSPDVVLTDLLMPERNGLELMKHIRRHNPKVKTIYMSGDFGRFSALLAEETKRFPVSFLEKPFSKEELMKLLSKFSSEGGEKPIAECGLRNA